MLLVNPMDMLDDDSNADAQSNPKSDSVNSNYSNDNGNKVNTNKSLQQER